MCLRSHFLTSLLAQWKSCFLGAIKLSSGEVSAVTALDNIGQTNASGGMASTD